MTAIMHHSQIEILVNLRYGTNWLFVDRNMTKKLGLDTALVRYILLTLLLRCEMFWKEFEETLHIRNVSFVTVAIRKGRFKAASFI